MREKGIFFTSVSALAYGLVPLFTVYLYQASFDAISIGFFRFLGMGIYTFFVAKISKNKLKINHSLYPSILLAAIVQCMTILLLNVSYQIIPTGNATSLHFMYPIFVSLILFFYYRNPITKRQWTALFFSLLGILFFIDFTNLGNFIGLLLALTSGFTYAMYMVILEKQHLSDIPSCVLTTYLCIIESGILFVLGLFKNSFLISFSQNALFYLIILIALTIIGQLLLQKGTFYIGAAMASIFCLFEPLTSLISGCLFLADPIRITNLVGCLFICTGILKIVHKERK